MKELQFTEIKTGSYKIEDEKLLEYNFPILKADGTPYTEEDDRRFKEAMKDPEVRALHLYDMSRWVGAVTCQHHEDSHKEWHVLPNGAWTIRLKRNAETEQYFEKAQKQIDEENEYEKAQEAGRSAVSKAQDLPSEEKANS